MINKERREYINKEIKAHYATEDSIQLSRRLGISLSYLRVRAKRLNCRKSTRTITNEIIDGKKLCPKCCKTLTIDKFNKDKYQPNSLDYWCRECRHKAKLKPAETVINNSFSGKSSSNKSMAFGVRKTRNPVITVIFEGTEVKGYKCKGCTIDKPYWAFYKLRKSDPDDTLNRKNICIRCMEERRKANKEL